MPSLHLFPPHPERLAGPRGPNRRVRVEEVADEEDRPRSRQRTTGPAAANSQSQDGIQGQAPRPPEDPLRPRPTRGAPGLSFIPIGTIVPLRPANSFNPGMGIAFTMTVNGAPVGGVPFGQPFGTGQQHQPQGAEANAEANGDANGNAHPHAHHHHQPINPFEFFTLLAPPDLNPDFLNFMGNFGVQEEQDDPERAKKLVDGLETVPAGLVKRMERVGGAPGAHLDDASSASAGGDAPGCAICWDKLLPDVTDEAAVPTGVDESASSADDRIVSLPCAHVFHAACLIPWFSRPRHTTCPTCRFNVDPENLTYVRRPRRRPTPQAETAAGQPNGATPTAQPEAVVSDAPPPRAEMNTPAEPGNPPPAQPQPAAEAQPHAPGPNPRPAPRFFVQPMVTVDFNMEFGAPGQEPRTFNFRHGPEAANGMNPDLFPTLPFPFPFAQPAQNQADAQPTQPPVHGPEPPQPQPQPQAQAEPQTGNWTDPAPFPTLPFPFVPAAQNQAGGQPTQPPVYRPQQAQPQPQPQQQPQPQTANETDPAILPSFPFPFPFAQAAQNQAGGQPAQPPVYGPEPPQPQPQQQPQPQTQGAAGPPPTGNQDPAAWLQWMVDQAFRGVVGEPHPQRQGPQPEPQQGPQPQQGAQPQPQGHPPNHGPQVFFGPPPPGFDMGAFGPMPIPMPGRGASRPREKKEWTPPPPPGPTLRQRVEQREREAGLRCDDVSCGLGPTDEDPIPCIDVASLRQLHIRPKGSMADVDARVCAHKFHPSCLVTAERVAGWGEKMEDDVKEEKMPDEEVEVSCPICRAVGVVSGADWEEGANAMV
ncbi:hypothetical protein OE88DRAFT_1657632 [Heliocybe sulcata]|uniref:RING-type domain-containing protein n=1 Tax=Heliocybe sulcata TaxID=5364 RepID=A0A5C3N6C4_9AGAM|nr:hypothetical protein OE88DRAFT_1657632 [Heliocybe sulcata]